MNTYTAKPIEVTAAPWNKEVSHPKVEHNPIDGSYHAHTNSGWVLLKQGDWLVVDSYNRLWVYGATEFSEYFQ